MSTERQFVSLVRRHRGIVYKTYNLYCHKDYPEDDYFQDVMAAAWKYFPTFEGRAKFSTWLYIVARNVAVGRWKKVTRSIRTVSFDNVLYQVIADVKYDDTERLAKQLQFIKENRIRHLFSALSEKEQELVVLYASGKPYREISAILKQDEAILRVHIQRIKERLAKKFGSTMDKYGN